MNKRMGRGQFLAWGTAAVLLLTSTACMPGQTGRPPETESKVPANGQSISAENVETREEPLAVSYTGKADLEEEPMKESNILIAYFTWAENTLSDGQVDASSSASVLLPGNVGQMAAWVRQETGGDLFSIRTKEPYPSDYDECLERAMGEKAEGARPALNGQVAHMEEYDTVFIGFPDWCYTAPMAVFSFLEENDLTGKRIVLFCSHGTGGLASSVKDISEMLPDSEVESNVLGVYRDDVPRCQETIKDWLGEIGE